MGAFFTNIQIKRPKSGEPSVTEIINYITRLQEEKGFIKVDTEEEADKTIIITSSGGTSWISVYDEETEEQEIEKLDTLASLLSKEFETIALSVLLNASDYIHIGLHKNGVLEDSLNNFTDNLDIDFQKNKPEFWSDVLSNEYSFKDIIQAWKKKNILADYFLADFGKFCKMDTSNLLTGYYYLDQERPNEGIKLNFALKDKKNDMVSGPVKFELTMKGDIGFSVYLKDGEKKKAVWKLRNTGTPSTGFDIIITGECIEQGLVIPETVKVIYPGKNNVQKEFAGTFIESKATNGQMIFYLGFENFHIPEGLTKPHPMSPKDKMRFMYGGYDSSLSFEISFVGKKAGRGNLFIYFSPIANRQEGAYAESIDILITQ